MIITLYIERTHAVDGGEIVDSVKYVAENNNVSIDMLSYTSKAINPMSDFDRYLDTIVFDVGRRGKDLRYDTLSGDMHRYKEHVTSLLTNGIASSSTTSFSPRLYPVLGYSRTEDIKAIKYNADAQTVWSENGFRTIPERKALAIMAEDKRVRKFTDNIVIEPGPVSRCTAKDFSEIKGVRVFVNEVPYAIFEMGGQWHKKLIRYHEESKGIYHTSQPWCKLMDNSHDWLSIAFEMEYRLWYGEKVDSWRDTLAYNLKLNSHIGMDKFTKWLDDEGIRARWFMAVKKQNDKLVH